MTTQWGAPLTGAQMKLLLAAGLPDGNYHVVSPMVFWGAPYEERVKLDRYFLPASHIAYTLLEKGWLDGRNVALWFGGENAPDDVDFNGSALFRNGDEGLGSIGLDWTHGDRSGDIIAYTRKAEGMAAHTDGCFDDTVTIAKMTETGVSEVALSHRMTTEEVWGAIKFCRLMGLIREPTRLERFWATRDVPAKAFQLIEEAVENQMRGCRIQRPLQPLAPPPPPQTTACKNPRCDGAVEVGARKEFCTPQCKKRHDNLRWYYGARVPVTPEPKPCASCGAQFNPQGRQAYCTPTCQADARNKRRRELRSN
jgi:hypothetical protein